MSFYSPLRYPGGKSKLAKFVSQICVDNDINGHYVEPYAGGASVALFLLFEGRVSKITINDFDRSIYAFWYSVLHHSKRLCRLINDTEVNIESWHKQKLVQKNKTTAALLSLGFSTLFLNRTNVSGILDAGPIGGLTQKGNYKIDCRFNKPVIINRILAISRRKKDINLYNLDALKLIDEIRKGSGMNSSTIFYFDPPYYLKGPSLYINYYQDSDHKQVSKKIKEIKKAHWIVSYDNVDEINEIYKGLRKTEYQLSYSAGPKKRGKEVLFFSPKLEMPNFQIR